MNWATVAPETRLYKGKNIFRWDVSPGLEHHCGTCEKPLHNARTKTSCIGKHVEPCYRFHQQLHFIGRSHECFGCNHSDEMHHTRHKEILVLVRKITALDDLNRPNQTPSDSPSQSQSRRGSTFTTSTATPTETSSEFGEEAMKLTKSRRKRAKKLGLGSASTKRKVEAFPKEDTDFISEALHLSIHETKGGWEGTYVYVNKQPDVEQSIPEVEEAEDVQDVVDLTAALSVKPTSTPSGMTPRQRKCAKKFTAPVKHAGYRGGSRKFSPSGGLSINPFNGVDPQIFFRLGVEIVNPIKNSKARKELVAKLVAAVKNDLSIIKQEDQETAMRQEGFLRWAGKAAYQAIMDTRAGLDWATGQKIGNPRMPRKEAARYDQAFVGSARGADMEDRDETMDDYGKSIKTMVDDDPHVTKEKLNFAVKPQVIVVAEEGVNDDDQGWETPAAKHRVRKRRTEGGRIFRNEAKSGGIPTLRIVTT